MLEKEELPPRTKYFVDKLRAFQHRAADPCTKEALNKRLTNRSADFNSTMQVCMHVFVWESACACVSASAPSSRSIREEGFGHEADQSRWDSQHRAAYVCVLACVRAGGRAYMSVREFSSQRKDGFRVHARMCVRVRQQHVDEEKYKDLQENAELEDHRTRYCFQYLDAR